LFAEKSHSVGRAAAARITLFARGRDGAEGMGEGWAGGEGKERKKRRAHTRRSSPNIYGDLFPPALDSARARRKKSSHLVVLRECSSPLSPPSLDRLPVAEVEGRANGRTVHHVRSCLKNRVSRRERARPLSAPVSAVAEFRNSARGGSRERKTELDGRRPMENSNLPRYVVRQRCARSRNAIVFCL